MTNPGTTGLRGWWTLNTTDWEEEHNGYDNDYTLVDLGTTDVAVTAGQVGNGALFSSNRLYSAIGISSDISSDFDPGTDSFTIGIWENWQKSSTNAGTEYILDKITSFNVYHAANKIYFRVFDPASNATSISTSDNFTTTAGWNFIVCVVDSDRNMNLYIDNAEQAHGTAPAEIASRDQPLALSRDGESGQGWEAAYYGIQDEFFWYDRALTTDEIDYLYNSGAGVTYSDIAPPPATVASQNNAILFGISI